jgi:hypothetical protein
MEGRCLGNKVVRAALEFAREQWREGCSAVPLRRLVNPTTPKAPGSGSPGLASVLDPLEPLDDLDLERLSDQQQARQFGTTGNGGSPAHQITLTGRVAAIAHRSEPL